MCRKHIITNKSSLKADREVWGEGGGTIEDAGPNPQPSRPFPLKNLTKHTRELGNTQKDAQLTYEHEASVRCLSAHLRTRSIGQKSQLKHRAQGHASPTRTEGIISLRTPSDRITHTGTIDISRSDALLNLRYQIMFLKIHNSYTSNCLVI